MIEINGQKVDTLKELIKAKGLNMTWVVNQIEANGFYLNYHNFTKIANKRHKNQRPNLPYQVSKVIGVEQEIIKSLLL